MNRLVRKCSRTTTPRDQSFSGHSSTRLFINVISRQWKGRRQSVGFALPLQGDCKLYTDHCASCASRFMQCPQQRTVYILQSKVDPFLGLGRDGIFDSLCLRTADHLRERGPILLIMVVPTAQKDCLCQSRKRSAWLQQ